MKNKEMIDCLSKCAAIRCSKKTGKIDTTLTGTGYAMLNLWGLQNTTKSKETFVFTIDSGLLIAHYIGSVNGMPSVEWGEDHENIEDYAEGILEALAQ